MPNPFDKFDANPFDQFEEQPRGGGDFLSIAKEAGDPMIEGAKRTASNVPRSFGDYARAMGQGLLHPMESAKGIGSTLAGGVEKAFGRESPRTQQFDAMVRPYTSGGEFLETLQEDPVRIAADASTLMMGTGGLAKLGGAQRAGGAMLQAGAKMEPITATIMAATEVSKLIPGGVAPRLYQSAVKMSSKLSVQERTRAAQLALDNKVVPNIKGFQNLLDEVGLRRMEVDALVDAFQSTGPNNVTTVDRLLSNIGELRQKASLTGEAASIDNFVRKILKSNSEVVTFPDGRQVRFLKELNAQEINTLKRDLYKQLEGQYGEKFAPYQKQVRKSLAHNAMKLLEEWIPEIHGPNKRAKDLLDIKNAIEQGVKRIDQRDIMGIGVPIKTGVGGGVGAAAGANPYFAAGLGLVMGILDTPKVKARIAIAINTAKKEGVTIRPTSVAVRLGLYQGGATAQEAERQLTVNRFKVEHLDDKTLHQLFRETQ